MSKCLYCGGVAVIKCFECDKEFCNQTTDGISHAVYHLVRCRHKTVMYENSVFKCGECKETNVFKLGIRRSFVGDVIEGIENMKIEEKRQLEMESKLYNNNTENGKALNNNVLNNEKAKRSESTMIIKIRCTQCDDVVEIVKNKIFSIFPSGKSTINKGEMRGCEKREYPAIRNKFTAEGYINTFIPLIIAESMKEKEIKESMRQENVNVRFEREFAYFYFLKPNSELRLSIGDEIRFSHKSGVSFSGYVCEEMFSEELKVEIDRNGQEMLKQKEGLLREGYGEMPRINYTVEYVWRAVCYERMVWALKKLYRDRRKNEIFRYILKGRKETMKRMEVLTPPGYCKLNELQELAVVAALTRTVTLIQGPPGTGKTLVSAVVVYNAVHQLRKKVLVVAPSNTAVDQLAIKMNNAGLKVLRIMSRRRENGANEVDFLCLHNLLKEFGDTEMAKNELIAAADVVCCTCVSAGQKVFNKFVFPFVLIDEAVQSTEPLSLIPCVYGCTNLVLVGDHKQLGPTVFDKTVELCGLKKSLFERLLKVGVPPYSLTVQYRMHSDICEFPSEFFYNGQLLTGTTITKCLNFPNNFFYVSNGREETSQSGTSFINKTEAQLVENIIRFLFKNGVVEQQIGVITPYEGQRSYIMSKIFENEPGNLEISSVDGFQGREKDFIIVSLVRSNTYQGIGFVADKRRLNVMLTRAKYALVIVGNPFTLYKNTMWASLLDWYDKRGNIYEGPINALRRTSFKMFDMKALSDSV